MTMLLAATLLLGADPKPISVRSWLISANRELAVAAKENPITAAEAQFKLLPTLVPDKPITYRARIKSLQWKKGIIRAEIEQPLGWIRSRLGTGRQASYTRHFYFEADEKAAESLRRGQFLIVTAPLKVTTDPYAFTGKLKQTSYTLFRISITAVRHAHYYSEDISYVINGTSYPVVYDVGTF